jgi:hypothetical protein
MMRRYAVMRVLSGCAEMSFLLELKGTWLEHFPLAAAIKRS